MKMLYEINNRRRQAILSAIDTAILAAEQKMRDDPGNAAAYKAIQEWTWQRENLNQAWRVEVDIRVKDPDEDEII